ncbi:MAG TPA: glucoamylase family protein [Bryobacteraceae bacterium]|nr:glucoamylase family protein [Bryobacteraceae bacterium]
MKSRPLRIVLAFFPSGDESAERLLPSLQRVSVSACVIQGESRNIPDFCQRYEKLRFEGESMAAAETEPGRIEDVAKALRIAGSPAVFVLGPAAASEPEPIPEPVSITREAILTRLREDSAILDRTCTDLAEAARLDHTLSPAAEWILDNSYLIRTQVTEVERHLPRDYALWASAGNGHRSINALAQELVAKTAHNITEASIRECLKDYQQASHPLTIAELWAFPLFVRVALIDALARIAARVSEGQLLRESAYLWANRLATAGRIGNEVFENTLRQMGDEPVAGKPHFVTALAERLQDEELALGPAQHWIEQHFGEPLVEIVRAHHTREAGETVSTANAFGSLRAIGRLDYTTIFEEVSFVEAELRTDPAGVYPRSDFTTRDLSRRVVERVARYSGLDETEVARRAIQLAIESGDPATGHVTWYLLADGLARLEAATGARVPAGKRILRAARHHATPFYLAAVSLLTACFTLVAGSLAWEAGEHGRVFLIALVALAVLPLSELSIQIVNALVISFLPPDPLPKLDLRHGIPREAATLVVVPMMLNSVEVARAEIEKLEIRFLGNKNENIYYSLFSDFTDAPEQTMPQDGALLQAVREGIADLNARYGDRFILFHRPRTWSESEQSWIGRERKRGKLEDLNAFLNGKDHGILDSGHQPPPIAYVLSLDSDTQLPVEAARRLIETIAHPLNKVVIDPVTRVRKRGYTIIQPRVGITLPGATATRFTRVFADATGTDPYSRTVSDAQQDLFLEALFHGKAIYDVRAFHAMLGNRFPPDTLLSHDLIEGAHVGVGLASDIELFEQLPVDYGSFAARQHRWLRGDWQIARWGLRNVVKSPSGEAPNPLSVINRWRILDNLRRSLVPIAALLLLLLGWLTTATPGVWSLVVGLAVAIPAITPLLDRLAQRMQGTVHRWQGAADELVRALVMLSFLPHQAWLSIDAIARVIYRSSISRRKLLEWQTADRARAQGHQHRNTMFRQLLVIAALSAPLTVVLLLEGQFAPTAVFVVLWAGSPLLMRWMARPTPSRARKELSREETRFLRRVSRETWRFFDDLVGPESNWLPPDNTQLALRVEVAQRTSPTNIGLWFTSALAARDFGYLTPDEFSRRCSRTMESVERLERYEGHLLNWYDTDSLEPLNPRYVSTVDSGNLITACWVLNQGCRDILRAPILGHAGLRGLADTLAILEEKSGDDPSTTVAVRALHRLFHAGRNTTREGHELIARYRMAGAPIDRLRVAQRWHGTQTDERLYWAARLSTEHAAWTDTIERYLRWMETLALPPDSSLLSIGEDAVKLRRRALHRMPSLSTLAGESPAPVDSILAWKGTRDLRPELAAWIDQLAAEYSTARTNAGETVKALETLMANASKLADGINMRFLYDASRKLFGVGYAVGGPREFGSYYDLMASECRLTSLVAIAKGDLPAEHWFALYRPYSYSRSGQALLSWSGTMFEYLMPLLFTRTFANSMLDSACEEAVDWQIKYANQNNIPWGISESAYSALDSHQIYQYKAFGVPALALNPAVDDRLVVSPYSSVMALLVNPSAAADNLKRLKSLRMEGPMGFYEAIDFSRESRPAGPRGVLIYCYMAHHQGMSLAALNNVLHRDVMQRRFHADRRIRSVESLLFEGIPITRLPIVASKPRRAAIRLASTEDVVDREWTEETLAPRVHLQGNGRYAVMVTNSGGGYSRWNQFDVTRWRSDATLDPWGTFFYIHDLRSDEAWGSSHKPLGHGPGEITVRFASERAEIRRRVAGIETTVDITVAVDDDAELRRIRILNRSLRTRHLELTSYLELALAPHAADKSHPAFAKMFVETECPESGVLVAHRRPRSPGDPPIWAAHILVGITSVLDIAHETDRARFLGRGRTPENPETLRTLLSGSTGAVIDPIFSLRCRLSLDPRERRELAFVTVAASSREAVLALVQKYKSPDAISRAFEMSWTRAQLEFRFLGIGPGAAHRYQELASQLIYPNLRLRPPADRLVRNRLGQEGLWAHGISGDLPILAVTVSDARHLQLVRDALLAHAYWRLRGFCADLVILNQEGPSYDQPLRGQIMRHIEAHAADAGMDRPGGVFLRDWNTIDEDHRTLILASASIVLSGNRGSLQQQLVTAVEGPPIPPFVPAGGEHEEPSRPLPFLELPYFNGTGGFTKDGREYAIYLRPGTTTPAPWSNVIANANFGTLVTESGLGFTWFGNSQANRLTPWNNDPVSDPQSEVIYLRDDDIGAVWTPTPLPRRENDAYRARHGQGYTVFEHNSHAIDQELTVFVPTSENGNGDAVKICRLRLRNDSSRPRRITVTWFNDWVLGSNREDLQLHVRPSRDEASGAILARQYWSGAWRGEFAFAASSPKANSWSADRVQVLGRGGSTSNPSALQHVRLDNRAGAGVDPCAALQINLRLDQDQQIEVIFLLGHAATVEDARALVERYQDPSRVEAALSSTQQFWDSTLRAVEVRTPVLSIDLLLNRWLLYQAMSCRFWGRSALYQSSGAFGFRDQLQDSMAFVYAAPQLTRSHILKAAARQFPEGDVQHWWHGETGVGVRTRCSDDLVWLPYVVAQYIKVTGDSGILEENVPFIEGPLLADGEHERMFAPSVSSQMTTLWEHCTRALDHAWQLGPHQLPLIGNGDWNDGMNLVGVEGKGESVWLGWFLCAVLEAFAQLAETHADDRRLAFKWRGQAADLGRAIESAAWDGEWYKRAWFDDGSPLGSHLNEEARIDSLPQSWAVISGAADPARARQAMESTEQYLVKERERLALLFTPPFDHSRPNPGYIMGYPAGMRENGGQYTHGSLWIALAWARLREGARAARLLQLMNPIELTRMPEGAATFRGEPYVVPGDVSSARGRVGQCGWTWYTGAAAWMYRIWIEEVLGLKVSAHGFTVDPRIPADWPGFGMTYRHGSMVYEIAVTRVAGEAAVEVDGKAVSSGFIEFDGREGTRKVTVRVPAAGSAPAHPSALIAAEPTLAASTDR